MRKVEIVAEFMSYYHSWSSDAVEWPLQYKKRRGQKPFKHLIWGSFAKIVINWKPLTIVAKPSILDVFGDPDYSYLLIKCSNLGEFD